MILQGLATLCAGHVRALHEFPVARCGQTGETMAIVLTALSTRIMERPKQWQIQTPILRAPSILTIPASGAKVYKQELPW